ncbi:MAG: aldehyde dehydrogenase family protein [Candidatus Zhuqueibacterota bacterium]
MNYDQDLQSIQQARTLCSEAKEALDKMKSFTQKDVDRIVAGMVEAGAQAAHWLAELAVEETGFGVVADKTVKNELATRRVFEYIRDMKTVGVIRDIRNDKIVEIAEPVGVVAGIIPVTNPTSTTLFKAIIALKAKNTIVFSPHPNAVRCTKATVDLLQKAIEPLGAPQGAISVITMPTMKATEELMTNPNVAVILATGGSAMVKSAYSSGKPAFGVGPGNVPAFIEKSADVRKAVADIIASKTFDNGTVCASEQSVIVDKSISAEVKQALKDHRAYLMNAKESALVANVLVDSRLTINPKLVGQPAHFIAQQAGFQTPGDTTLLVAELAGVGKEYPLSVEKLSPVIAYYEVDGWEQGCQRCVELLKFGGMGHTLAIHSNNRDVIMEFALKKPAYRILVNTPSTHGAVGYTTNLPPSLTLGCGTYGGNITSDNISPLHLINIKRLAFETRPLSHDRAASQSVSSGDQKKLITEKDVRQAIARGEKIKLDKEVIVTPLARDLGRAHHVFE